MEKSQTTQKDSRQNAVVSNKKRLAFWVLVLCLLLTGGIVVTTALLGGDIGRFTGREANVILLVPPEDALSEESSENTGDSDDESEKVRGDLQVLDNVQTWSRETHVDLFRESYGDTVKSGNGENVIAPGTTNSYHFTVKNNGNIPMNYSISLKVETYLGEDKTCSELPLEWRLLSDDGAVVTDWKGYNERTETLKRDFLKVRNQDKYTIEWRWTFERGGDMDKTDTDMGNIVVNQDLGVDAAIYLYAEQCGGVGEDIPGPQTGDSSHIVIYIVLAALSVLVLVILFLVRRRGKNDKD